MFPQIKDRKHIEQNFHSVARSCPGVGLPGGLRGAGGVKNFSVGIICDGAPSTAHSSFEIWLISTIAGDICSIYGGIHNQEV